MSVQPDPIALVAEILELPLEAVSADSDLEVLGWDSLSNLEFIAIVDSRYHGTIDAAELAAAETPADLGTLLAAAA